MSEGADRPRTDVDVRATLEALAGPTADCEVRRRLHDVAPHRVYEVVVDGRRAVCKLGTDPAEADPATESRILRHVRRETSVPVPRVLAVGDEAFLAEWHDGVPDDPTLDADRARAMGAGLATLHAETSFAATGLFDAAPDEGLVLEADDTWADTLRARLENCREFLEGRDYPHAEVAEEVIAFLRERPEVLAGAGSGARGGAGGPALVHGNYLLDHVGVADGAVDCVIDFEHALAGPGEFDYWATVLPTFGSASGPDDPDRRAFREGYESVRPLPDGDGFDRRAGVYAAALGVTYLRSLYLQRNWASRAEADDRAADLAATIRGTLEGVRRGRSSVG